MSNQLVLTVIADDRPGLVDALAETLVRHGGNWLESALARLGGKFAGILLIEVAGDRQALLEEDLAAMAARGIDVSVAPAGTAGVGNGEQLALTVVGNDRRGIVGEISRILARCNVNVDELFTATENAPMSGERLFRAQARVMLPPDLGAEDLRVLLEDLSDDLVVELETPDEHG